MNFPTRVEPMLGCKLAGILKAVSGIENTVPIVHGPMGCASGYRIIPLFAGKEPLVATTSLTEMDIIMGSEDRLHEAVMKAQTVYDPELIVVILTCATSLTSDVISSMTKGISKEIGKPIFIIDGSGIVGDEIDGYMDFYSEFRKYEEKLVEDTSDQVLIDLSGLSAADYNANNDLLEICNLLSQGFDLEVARTIFHKFKFPTKKMKYKELKAGRLWLNDPSPCFAPIGITGLNAWIQKFTDLTGVQVSNTYIRNLHEKQTLLNNVKGKFNNICIGIEAESWWAIGLANFLVNELGCTVFISSDKGAVHYQKKYGLIAKTVVDMANIELTQFFIDHDVNVVFGSSYCKKDDWAWIPYWQPVWHAVDEQPSIFGLDGIERLLTILTHLEEWSDGRKTIHFK